MTREIHVPALGRSGPTAHDSNTLRPRLEVWGHDGTDLEVDPRLGTIVGEWRPIPGKAQNLDLPTAAELCKCCGQVLLVSGSRFSIWFCEQCDSNLQSLNDEARHCLIPRGRHSLCNGVSLVPADRPTSEQLDEFIDAMRDLGHSITVLNEWAPEIVRRNCARLGLSERTTVPLAEYLRACEAGGRATDEAFTEMIGWRFRRIDTKSRPEGIGTP